ncbi:hypothetical protein OKW11_006235 [Pseudomonas baetica]|nr:hypothetical protein [Pseudomonas baetica]
MSIPLHPIRLSHKVSNGQHSPVGQVVPYKLGND